MVETGNISKFHEPVLLQEVIHVLRVRELARSKRAKFIDATLGLGGHTEAIVKLGGHVLGIEADSESLRLAEKRLQETCPTPEVVQNILRGSYKLIHGNFRDIDKFALQNGFGDVDGIIFDPGISSYQLGGERGFTFQRGTLPLDMRIDPGFEEVTASDLVTVLSERQLTEIFEKVLPKSLSSKLAERLVAAREIRHIRTVSDFLWAIKGELGFKRGLHFATLPLLALRIAVNSEIENLREGLPKALGLLKIGGRLVVITFHSGEDRVVKDFFNKEKLNRQGKILTKKPIVPKDRETERNPRARSAKMRVLEKL